MTHVGFYFGAPHVYQREPSVAKNFTCDGVYTVPQRFAVGVSFSQDEQD